MLKLSSMSPHHPLYARRRVLRRVPFGSGRFLAALEGIEGGFAIGTSIVVALSLAGLSKEVLLLTAVVSIVVSGFNSASMKYSSEHYLDELDGREKRSATRHYFLPALIEFVCYFMLSFMAVLPLLLIRDVTLAVAVSVVVTLTMLFIAGFWRGHVLRMNRLRDAFEAFTLGVGIILVGAISGLLLGSL